MKLLVQILLAVSVVSFSLNATADVKEQICFNENSWASIIGLQMEGRSFISIDQIQVGDWARTDDGVYYIRVEEIRKVSAQWNVVYSISNGETGETAMYSIEDTPWTRSGDNFSRVEVTPKKGVAGVTIQQGRCSH